MRLIQAVPSLRQFLRNLDIDDTVRTVKAFDGNPFIIFSEWCMPRVLSDIKCPQHISIFYGPLAKLFGPKDQGSYESYDKPILLETALKLGAPLEFVREAANLFFFHPSSDFKALLSRLHGHGYVEVLESFLGKTNREYLVFKAFERGDYITAKQLVELGCPGIIRRLQGKTLIKECVPHMASRLDKETSNLLSCLIFWDPSRAFARAPAPQFNSRVPLFAQLHG